MTAWVLPAILSALFLLFSAANINAIFRGGSLVPFAGAVFGAAAVVTMPLEGSWKYFWIPVLIEPGTLITVVGTIVLKIRGQGGEKEDQ